MTLKTNKRFVYCGVVILLLIFSPVYAASDSASENDRRPIIDINIDFQGVIDGIVNGLGGIINKVFLDLPGMMWDYFYEKLLLKPLGLDAPEKNDDIISASGFFLANQPDIEPFRGTIEKLSELLIIFLAFGIIFVSVKACWDILLSEEARALESVFKTDILPLFIGSFGLSLSVEIYQILLYIAHLITLLFVVNIDQLIFRNFALYLISPDLLGLLGVALVFLFALFLLFTYILILVIAFLIPVFITLSVLPFDTSKAMGQAGLNFAVLNAFMPAFSAIIMFIATSVWASTSFWQSLSLSGYALFLTKRMLGMVFLLLAILIPLNFYFTALIVPVIRYAIGFKILKGVNLIEKTSNSSHNDTADSVSGGPRPP